MQIMNGEARWFLETDFESKQQELRSPVRSSNEYFLDLPGQYWRHLLGPWSADNVEGSPADPTIRYFPPNESASVPLVPHPNPTPPGWYFPSQFTQESPDLSASSSSSGISPESRSQTSEDTEGERRSSSRWSRAEVLLLISCYSERRARFKDINTKNKTLWEEISKELQKKGASYSAKLCETKMKNLKRSYVICVDHNNTTGNNPKKCTFFDELHEVFSRDDAIRPTAVCSNLDGPVKRKKGTVNEEKGGCSSSTSDTEECPVPKPRKKKIAEKKNQEDLVCLFKEFTQDRKEEEQEKLNRMENMHQERMELMNRFLNVFEKSVKKD